MKYAILDVETTGLTAKDNNILEIGILLMNSDGEYLDRFETLVNPQRHVGADWVHGITTEMVAKAPMFGDIAEELLDFLDGVVIAAHNAAFDISFLQADLKRAGFAIDQIPSICTLQLSRRHIAGRSSYSLENLCTYLDITNTLAHSAMADAEATSQLLLHLLRNYPIEESITESSIFKNQFLGQSFNFGSGVYTRKDYTG